MISVPRRNHDPLSHYSRTNLGTPTVTVRMKGSPDSNAGRTVTPAAAADFPKAKQGLLSSVGFHRVDGTALTEKARGYFWVGSRIFVISSGSNFRPRPDGRDHSVWAYWPLYELSESFATYAQRTKQGAPWGVIIEGSVTSAISSHDLYPIDSNKRCIKGTSSPQQSSRTRNAGATVMGQS